MKLVSFKSKSPYTISQVTVFTWWVDRINTQLKSRWEAITTRHLIRRSIYFQLSLNYSFKFLQLFNLERKCTNYGCQGKSHTSKVAISVGNKISNITSIRCINNTYIDEFCFFYSLIERWLFNYSFNFNQLFFYQRQSVTEF